MSVKQTKFPTDFKLGVATASVQIEGGDTNNSWYDWCEAGNVANGDHCIIANDHWNRVDEDISCMKDLNINSYRLSIEWGRIQPTKDTWNQDALQHYREEIKKLVANGIEPMITLHHFSNPSWFEDEGAWMKQEHIKYFKTYTKVVVEALGDLCSLWVTINEPNVYLVMGYMEGDFPPGKKGDMKSFFRGAKIMINAHVESYKMIHKVRTEIGFTDTKVGAALHLRVFDMLDSGPLSRIAKKMHYYLFQDLFFEGMLFGKWMFGRKKGVFFDFLGINYYTRDMLKSGLVNIPLFAKRHLKEDCETNDLAWEIYPKGLLRLMSRYHDKYSLPIFITENGIADKDDLKRTIYIKDHLAVILEALDIGLPVKGYYHWTLMDNFEWAEGYEARFGLFKHDVKTQKRTLRSSGKYYSEICRNRTL